MTDLSCGSSEYPVPLDVPSIGRIDCGLLARLTDASGCPCAMSNSTELKLVSARPNGELSSDSEEGADIFDRFNLRNGSWPLVMLRVKSSPSVSSVVVSFEVDAKVFNCFDVCNGPRPVVMLILVFMSAASSDIVSLDINVDLRLEAIEKPCLQLRTTDVVSLVSMACRESTACLGVRITPITEKVFWDRECE